MFQPGISGNPKGCISKTALTTEVYAALLAEHPSATASAKVLLQAAARLLARSWRKRMWPSRRGAAPKPDR
jgi:hypothetical protein